MPNSSISLRMLSPLPVESLGYAASSFFSAQVSGTCFTHTTMSIDYSTSPRQPTLLVQ